MISPLLQGMSILAWASSCQVLVLLPGLWQQMLVRGSGTQGVPGSTQACYLLIEWSMESLQWILPLVGQSVSYLAKGLSTKRHFHVYIEVINHIAYQCMELTLSGFYILAHGFSSVAAFQLEPMQLTYQPTHLVGSMFLQRPQRHLSSLYGDRCLNCLIVLIGLDQFRSLNFRCAWIYLAGLLFI